MRSACSLALFLAPVLSQSNVPCNQMSVDQCASACSCQRVACCCGPNCDKLGSQVNYNRCVAVGSDVSTWNCPSIDSCSSYGGRAMTITPCTPGAPTPASNPDTAPTTTPVLDFGTTFPMIGTQAVPHQSFQGNVYFGTSMKFNPGAYWSYTDSYNVPNWNSPSYDSSGNQVSTGTPGTPTPAPDYTGIPCFIASPCPSGYYCKLNTGNNVQQQGFCTKLSTDYYAGGAGQWTDSDMYNSYIHPPLVLDPNHNGPANTAGSGPGYYGYNSYGGGYAVGGYGAGGYPGYSPPAVPGSCAGPSVCGYKSATGDCWCDGKCQSTGDCCPDITQYCSYR